MRYAQRLPEGALVRALWLVLLLAGASSIGNPAIPTAHATLLPEERVPTFDPLYRDLERLATRFGETPRFLSSRPLRRAEARVFLDRLKSEHPHAATDPAFRRLQRALDADAPGGLQPLMDVKGERGESVEWSPYVSVGYSDDVRNAPDVDRDHRLGFTFSAGLDSTTILVLDAYAGTSSQGGRGTPSFSPQNAIVEGTDFNTWMREAYMERGDRLRVLVGHAWLRWGPGRTGTLALSDAAPALDLVRGELTILDRWRLSWFGALLDPGRQTYLAGHRVEWSPGSRTTVGFTEVARFDGTSQAPLYLLPLVPYSFWEKRRKSSIPGAVPGDTSGVALGKNNVLWSSDAVWSPRPGWRMWGELMVDDLSFSRDYKPDMIGYQVGAEFRRGMGRREPGAGRAIGATAEFSRVHNYTYSVFHNHHFAHQDFPLGFVHGPDVATLWGEVSLESGPSWEIRLGGEWTKKGEGRLGNFWSQSDGRVDASRFAGVAAVEKRASATIAYSPSRALRLQGTAGISSARNEGHLRGRSRDSFPFALAATITW